MNEASEKRNDVRLSLRRPVQIEVSDHGTVSPQRISGQTIDVNQHGIGVEIRWESTLSDLDMQYTLCLDNYRLPAVLAWKTKDRAGFRLLADLPAGIAGELAAVAPKIKKFNLYIGGNDIDSGKYEFFPYADKFITSFRKTYGCLSKLKQGQVPLDAQDYIFARYSVADRVLNDAAVRAAHEAFLKFRDFSLETRHAIMTDIRLALMKEKENLIELMKIEGHPRKLAEWEFSGMSTAFRAESLAYFRDQIMSTAGEDGDETLMVVRRPDGVFGVCPPKNASCSNSLTAAFALLAGNTLVVKPPLKMPISTIYLWRNVVGKVLDAHGAPAGTINIVLGNSKDFVDSWLENPYMKGVLFFNDSEAGLEMGRRIYEKGKKPILELAGNDYMAVWKDAPIEGATDSLLDAFMGSTQICMVPKKALIHEDIFPQFADAFVSKAGKLKVGLPSDPDTILSPVMKIKEFFDCLDDALRNGAKLLTGGVRVNHLGEPSESGPYITPAVLEVPQDCAALMKCVQSENFFPLIPLIKIKGNGASGREKDRVVFDKMKRMLEANEYGLRLSVWVRDPFYLRKCVSELHGSGLLRINSRHTAFSSYISTHGGVGKSGGPFGEMNYIWQKTSHLQGISITQLELPPIS